MRVGNEAPVNKLAAVVVFSKGEAFSKVHSRANVSSLPLAIRTDRLPNNDPHFINYTGTKVGALQVIGLALLPKHNKKGGSTWVCRCLCGNYCYRRNKAIRDNKSYMCCDECQVNRKLSRGWIE